MRIDIYTDTVCPWCFLGKRRFDLALGMRPQYEPEVTWRPFELNPDLTPEGADRAAYIATRIGDQERFAETEKSLTALGAAVGIRFRFDLIQRVPNTRRSHLLVAHASRSGLQGEVTDRIMRAYFEEGRDIGEIDELVRLGVELGLSEYETRHALVVRAGQDAVVAAERHAAVLGLTAVPAFVFDRLYTLSGAQEPAALAGVLDRVAGFAVARVKP
jgi:predicted DsbA family dithiol-disulfide isomerase